MSPATVSPAGPLPTTAIFLPVGAAFVGISTLPVALSQSARNRSILPIPTDFVGSWWNLPTVQPSWHWASWGHTLPQTAGSTFLRLMILMPRAKSPFSTASRKPGMSMPTGQPSVQNGRLHRTHRHASFMAASGPYPCGTSLWLPMRSCGDCSGMG